MSNFRKRGRPVGDGGARKVAILEAAMTLFGTLGYDNSSVRLIAEHAGVDAKLVSHYFGNKASLFAAVMKLPEQADAVLGILRTVNRKQWGAQIVDLIIDKDGLFAVPQMVGVIKSASSDESVAKTLREFYIQQSLEPTLERLGVSDAKVRASTFSSLLAGLTFSDQILSIPIEGAELLAKRKKLIQKVVQATLTENLR